MLVSTAPQESLALDFHPVTSDRWPDVVRLFEHHGNPGYCWCMRWRATSREFQRLGKEGRGLSLEALVRSGVPTGVLAYRDGEPIAWCSVAPRETYEALERSRVLRRLDDASTWSVVCFFVDRRFRRRNVTAGLLQAAVAYARSHNAEIIEGYPVEPEAASYRFMGGVTIFQKAGFRDATAGGQRRKTMRYFVDEEMSLSASSAST